MRMLNYEFRFILLCFYRLKKGGIKRLFLHTLCHFSFTTIWHLKLIFSPYVIHSFHSWVVGGFLRFNLSLPVIPKSSVFIFIPQQACDSCDCIIISKWIWVPFVAKCSRATDTIWMHDKLWVLRLQEKLSTKSYGLRSCMRYLILPPVRFDCKIRSAPTDFLKWESLKNWPDSVKFALLLEELEVLKK